VIRNAAARPLSSPLEEYLGDLEKRNRTGRNGRGARQLKMRVGTWLSMSPPIRLLPRGPGKEISQDFQQTMVSFLNWLERVGRIKGNPLKFVEKIDERGQSKRVRRAFTDDELRRLVAGSGRRGIVYFTAARTGLRQEELRQLIWEDVGLMRRFPMCGCGLSAPRIKRRNWFRWSLKSPKL